jgi:DNA-binding response OmpR family regulator
MKIAICDDDRNELFRILSILADYQLERNTEFSYKPFKSSVELSAEASHERYDIYLLDIVMPGLDGMELAREIRSYDKAADIIFLTSSSEFAVESYQVKASNYLMKPLQKDRVFEALDDIIRTRIEDRDSCIVLRSNIGVHKVRLSEIVYVEALNRKVIYYLKNNSQITCAEVLGVVLLASAHWKICSGVMFFPSSNSSSPNKMWSGNISISYLVSSSGERSQVLSEIILTISIPLFSFFFSHYSEESFSCHENSFEKILSFTFGKGALRYFCDI